MYLAHAGLFYFMPNTKKIAPLVQDTNTATLSHETAKISKLSTEGKEKLIKVLKLFPNTHFIEFLDSIIDTRVRIDFF